MTLENILTSVHIFLFQAQFFATGGIKDKMTKWQNAF